MRARATVWTSWKASWLIWKAVRFELTSEWEKEKDERWLVPQKLKEQLDHARQELEQAQRQGDLARAGELAYGVIPDLEAKLKEAEEAEDSDGSRMLDEAGDR